MSKAVLAARGVLGLIFVVFGLNGFFNFIPVPPMPEEAGMFLGSLAASGYMFPLIKSIEVLTGAMILVGFQLPFALLLLAPIAVNILLFHAAYTGMGPQSIGMPVVIVGLMVFLARAHWRHYAGIFKA